MFDFWKKVCFNIDGASPYQEKELNLDHFYFYLCIFAFARNFFQKAFGRALQEEKMFRHLRKLIIFNEFVSLLKKAQ